MIMPVRFLFSDSIIPRDLYRRKRSYLLLCVFAFVGGFCSWSTPLHRYRVSNIHGNEPPTRNLSFLKKAPSAAAAASSSSSTSFSDVSHDANTRQEVASTRPTPPTTVILDPLVVCGPSGVGKGTIIGKFMELLQQQQQRDSGDDIPSNNTNTTTTTRDRRKLPQFAFAVSHTTRAPRPGEIDGVHYHFVSVLEMQRLIAMHGNEDNDADDSNIRSSNNNNDDDDDSRTTSYFFVEHATVHGNIYGTSWTALHNVQTQQTLEHINGGDNDVRTPLFLTFRKALLDIDVQGVRRLKAIQQEQQQQLLASSNRDDEGQNASPPRFLLQPKYIFIVPPNLETLSRRLEARGTETPESLDRRTRNAKAELEYGLSLSSSSTPTFDAIVVNDQLDQAVADFAAAVARLYDLDTQSEPTTTATTTIAKTKQEEEQRQHQHFIHGPSSTEPAVVPPPHVLSGWSPVEGKQHGRQR